MMEKLRALDLHYADVEARLSAPETYEDPALVARLNKEQRELEPVVMAYRAYQRRRQDLEDAEALMGDPDMKELAQEEYQQAREELARLEEEIKVLLLPRDPNDDKNVIVEIRAGVGGEEAALFAHSLFRMYSMYADARRWRVEVDSVNETELGGVKEICFTIEGDGAWSRLKFESGVHRVQRVPETESGGRIHTSTATVAVLPEVDEVDFELNPADIEMQVFRSSGAGGQHINKTSSAVRLIHKPTGTVVECQQERSQFQNRDRAMQILRSRLYEEKVREQEEAVTAERRSQVGTGMRNERIRTYNFPQGRLTDHRIGLTLYRLESVMGNLCLRGGEKAGPAGRAAGASAGRCDSGLCGTVSDSGVFYLHASGSHRYSAYFPREKDLGLPGGLCRGGSHLGGIYLPALRETALRGGEEHD